MLLEAIQSSKILFFFLRQVTTFSRLLTASDLEPLKQMTHGVELLSLQQFETEYSFLKKIRSVD